MNIQTNIKQILSKIPTEVKLVAVSKTKPNEDILKAHKIGHKRFGENKVQDLVQKYESLPKDIEWHYIGHLQRNKVKFIAPFVSMIHAVDSLRLLQKINEEAQKNGRKIKCLLQMHIGEESTKFGMDMKELKELLQSDEIKNFNHVSISGLMGMATYTDDESQIRGEFRYLKKSFDSIKTEFFKNIDTFKEISMGMSGDYLTAIEEGSTMVRIGSIIFGERNY